MNRVVEVNARENLIYPISRYELNKLKNGKIATPHWHDVVEKGDVYCAIIGINPNPQDYDYLRERGINCLGCPITKDTIRRIKNEEIIIARYKVEGWKTVEVHLMLDHLAKKLPSFNKPQEEKEGVDILDKKSRGNING